MNRKRIVRSTNQNEDQSELRIEKVEWEAQFMIESIVISLIDDNTGPLVRAAITTPLLYLSSSDIYHKMELTVWDMQIANLLQSTPFPALLAPIRPPVQRSSRTAAIQVEQENFLHITAIKVRGAGDLGADYFKYIGISVKPFDLKAEGAILMRLTSFKDRVMEALKNSSADGSEATTALASLFPSPSIPLFTPPAITENRFTRLLIAH